MIKRFGLHTGEKEVLGVCCGSGYGAGLLLSAAPSGYVGVGLMPEQISLAQQGGLGNACFPTMDATDLSAFADAS